MIGRAGADMKQCSIVDAFTDRIFAGNPAAVCVTDRWPEDAMMQQIAGENCLPETAFAVREGDNYRLRWFTPGGEIDLCGHATLATAFVLMNFAERGRQEVRFETRSGQLTAAGDQGYDCVSRTFGPKCGIPEDPVCGSGHCHIVPYWSGRLGKTGITAYQASRRGGTLYCEYAGERVKLAGKAALFAESEIFV